ELMNRKLRNLVLLTACSGLAFALTPTARAQGNRFYAEASAGGQATQDTALKEFFGEPLPSGAKVTFDPGIRIGFIGGFHVTDWFGAEFETGVMANNIRSMSGASRADAFY